MRRLFIVDKDHLELGGKWSEQVLCEYPLPQYNSLTRVACNYIMPPKFGKGGGGGGGTSDGGGDTKFFSTQKRVRQFCMFASFQPY
jgi:hypothetical protein